MLLSVIIPIHNSEKYILDCIKSIYKQNLKQYEFELILVNNASTDRSLEICYKIKEDYKNVIVINTNEAGVSNARNLGINIAQGKYIHFVDSDDELLDGMYKKYKYIVNNNNNVDFIVSGIDNYYEKNNIDIYEKSNYMKNINNREKIKEELEKLDYGEKNWLLNVVWNKWYKRELIVSMKITFDTSLSLGEDFVFNCRFFSYIESYIALPEVYYRYYHRNRVSAVNKFRKDILHRRERMYREQIKLFYLYGLNDNKTKEKIQMLNGELLFKSIYTIFQKDCTLTKDDKYKLFLEILENPMFLWSKKYLDKKDNLFSKVLLILLNKKRYKDIYIIMKLKNSYNKSGNK